ncbi:class E sortase [Streptomyces sp. NPDC020965]|uniref:class E sortase n=1 Tax=Streptomyces sp. NPDC020965 TaxID=3365105 RepID=UPI0037BDAB53
MRIREKRARIPVVVHGARSRARTRWVGGLWVCAEVTVTLGIVGLLLVVHQLWWTNLQARQGAERQVHALERSWQRGGEAAKRQEGREGQEGWEGLESGEAAGVGGAEEEGGRDRTPETGAEAGARGEAVVPARRWAQAYAVLRIPSLGVTAPVADGISKKRVLDKGYIGHYPGTARPGQPGNFAVAGHRNTHGEPFRRINRLRPGDDIRIETRDAVFVYEVGQTLARTSPRDIGVIRPVPRSLVTPSAGYRTPGHYLTLTTCTPEYSSSHRLVVWATLTATQPRDPV